MSSREGRGEVIGYGMTWMRLNLWLLEDLRFVFSDERGVTDY